MIGIEKRHGVVEIMHAPGRRISNGRTTETILAAAEAGLEPHIEPILDAREEGFRILRINLSARRYGTRQKLCFPSEYREDVEDFHAGLCANERQPLRRRAVGVELPIRVAPVGSSNNRSVVRGSSA